ncbi:MAG: hypothetical protein ACC628_09830 [Pirellulaceae bacterium]
MSSFEFDIECPLCGTRLEARSEQIGTQIQCPDCTTAISVRLPPKRKRRERTTSAPEDGELRLNDPVETSLVDSIAHGILESAEREVAADDPQRAAVRSSSRDAVAKARTEHAAEEAASPKLPERPFTQGILSFLVAPTTVPRWIGLALALQVELFLISVVYSAFEGPGAANVSGGTVQASGPVILAVLSLVAAILLGLLVVPTWSISMLTILQVTDDGKPSVENWPGADFLDWFGDSLYVIAAAFVSALPGLIVAQTFLTVGIADSLYTSGLAFCSVLSFVFVFPVVLVSMLEGGSPIHVLSRPVGRSLGLVPSRWLQFFALVVILALAGRFVWQGRRAESVVLNFLVSLALVGLSILYFRLLGRLARCCQEAIAEADLSEEEEREEE